MSRPTHEEWVDEIRADNANTLDLIAEHLARIATALETLASPPVDTEAE